MMSKEGDNVILDQDDVIKIINEPEKLSQNDLEGKLITNQKFNPQNVTLREISTENELLHPVSDSVELPRTHDPSFEISSHPINTSESYQSTMPSILQNKMEFDSKVSEKSGLISHIEDNLDPISKTESHNNIKKIYNEDICDDSTFIITSETSQMRFRKAAIMHKSNVTLHDSSNNHETIDSIDEEKKFIQNSNCTKYNDQILNQNIVFSKTVISKNDVETDNKVQNVESNVTSLPIPVPSLSSKEQEPSKVPANNKDTSNFECNICFDDVSDPVVTRCGHLFCWICLHGWLERGVYECPVCKAGVTRETVVPIYGRGSDSVDPRARTESTPQRPRGERPAAPQSRSILDHGRMIRGTHFSFGLFPFSIGMSFGSGASSSGISPMAGFGTDFNEFRQMSPEEQRAEMVSVLLMILGFLILFCLLFLS